MRTNLPITENKILELAKELHWATSDEIIEAWNNLWFNNPDIDVTATDEKLIERIESIGRKALETCPEETRSVWYDSILSEKLGTSVIYVTGTEKESILEAVYGTDDFHRGAENWVLKIRVGDKTYIISDYMSGETSNYLELQQRYVFPGNGAGNELFVLRAFYQN